MLHHIEESPDRRQGQTLCRGAKTCSSPGVKTVERSEYRVPDGRYRLVRVTVRIVVMYPYPSDIEVEMLSVRAEQYDLLR